MAPVLPTLRASLTGERLGLLVLAGLLLLSTAAVGMGGAISRPVSLPTGGPSAPVATTSLPTVPLSQHVLFPPARPMAGIGNCTTTPVVPGCGYSAEPAPMGIADYGVSGYGNPTPYAYGTTAFLGTVSWTNAYIYSSAEKGDFSVQENVVLNFINDGQNYSYWIQNVPVPVDSTKNDFQMSYADNIWNFSCASTTCNLATNTVTGNGTDDGGVYIWPASANSGCGSVACVTLDGPSWFSVEVRSFLNAQGEPEVRFCYFDPDTTLTCYDTVTFGFAHDVTLDRGFFVDGFSMNPTGLFEDAELTFGGPGNGASTDNTGPSNIQTSLEFWNGFNFQAVRSAWNAGDDTAEAIEEDQSVFSNDGSGMPISVQLNGTTREDFENPSYTEGQVGTLDVWAPGTNTGTVAVGKDDSSYQFGRAALTLDPGTYPVWVNASSSTYLGACTITAASTLNVTAATGCSGGTSNPLTVSAPTGSPSSLDVGQTASFTATASGGTGSYSSYAWSVLPSTGLACTPSTSTATTSCSATAAGSYTVSVTVTDSSGATASATSAAYRVYPDPTVAVPTASATSITVGQSVTFTSSLGLAGSGGDTFSWTASSSSAGCTASTTTTYGCTPTAAGSYTVTAKVTDSNGGSGQNTSAAVTVTASTPPLSVTSPTATPAGPVMVGQSVSWSATASGGTSPYSYAWSSSPVSGLGCPATGDSPITCTPTAAGTYTLTVTVTDSASHTASATSSSFVVDPALAATIAGPASVTAGTAATFNGSASGGFAPYTWSWDCAGSSTGSAQDISCTWTTAGTYEVTLTVTDSEGDHVSQETSITVTAVSTGGTLTVNAAATPNPVTLGGTVSFSASVTEPSGSSGTYTYAWTFGDGGTSALASPEHNYTTTGTFQVTLTVTDQDGRTGSSTFSVVVQPATTPSSSSTNGFLGSTWFWVLLLVVAAVAIAAIVLSRRRHEPAPEGAAAWGAAGAAGGAVVGGSLPSYAPSMEPAPVASASLEPEPEPAPTSAAGPASASAPPSQDEVAPNPFGPRGPGKGRPPSS